MGSNSSKFNPESVVGGQKKEHPINFVSSSHSNATTSNGGINSGKLFKPGESNITTKESNFVNTSFKWNFGGQNVLLTGTFTNWKDHIPLQKVGNEFSVILRLQRGVYQYKFIVDGDWKFSPDDSTTADEHGNINNFVDTTNVETVNRIIDTNKSKHQQPKQFDKYGNQIPYGHGINSNHLNFSDAAPPIPPHLLSITFLNERDRVLGCEVPRKSTNNNHQFMDIEKDSEQGSNFKKLELTYKLFENSNSLTPPTHVVLNHMGIQKTNEKTTYTVTTMTQRFKSKYATIKFYSSKFTE